MKIIFAQNEFQTMQKKAKKLFSFLKNISLYLLNNTCIMIVIHLKLSLVR